MRGALWASFALISGAAVAEPIESLVVNPNRAWEVLPSPAEGGMNDTFRAAAEQIGELEIYFGRAKLNRHTLSEIVEKSRTDSLTRVARETLRQAVDVHDLLLFLDDLFVAAKAGVPEGKLYFTPGRARHVGVTVHPDEVFKGRVRNYAPDKGAISLAEPVTPEESEEYEDSGTHLGPHWVERFENPAGEAEMILALSEWNPSFGERIESLIDQLRLQGADVYVSSTVRDRRRGYLMWGAFWLSKANNKRQTRRRVRVLRSLNRVWRLNVPVRWYHPEGWRTTVSRARQMKEAYDVVYATRNGARNSHHYDGLAIDFTARALPRTLTLIAPDGVKKSFDLSEPTQTRDISLTPELVEWIEAHFGFKKLRSDYPHWDDALRADDGTLVASIPQAPN